MLLLKTACFAILGALMCSGIALVLSVPGLIVIGGILESVFDVDEVAWYGFAISPLFAIIGLLVGAYYGAVFALRTRGYSLREYGRTIWAFLNNV
jgi:uncharacterized membrane protein